MGTDKQYPAKVCISFCCQEPDQPFLYDFMYGNTSSNCFSLSGADTKKYRPGLPVTLSMAPIKLAANFIASRL